MKRINISSLKPKEKDNTLNEVRILASIQNPYIISKHFINQGYKDAFFDAASNDFCVVTEYADGGDLFELIKEYKKARKYVSEKRVWNYIEQIAIGIRFV